MTITTQTIGVFGASFNPPTLGHKDLLMQAKPQFDRILLVPSVRHPFAKSLLPISHRVRMLQIFLQYHFSLTQKKFELFHIEPVILQSHPHKKYIYTVDVLERLEQHYQIIGEKVKLRFIMGPDLAKPDVWHKFHQYQLIEQRWPPFIGKENIAARSQKVREIFGNLTNAKKESLNTLLDPAVLRYIMAHQLYQNTNTVVQS